MQDVKIAALFCERETYLNAILMKKIEIKNKVNGKILIGSSSNLPAILNRFKTELKLGNCRNVTLQKDWKQFGPEAFEFEELEILKPLDDPSYDPADDLRFLEELWTEKLKPYGEKGYNK